THGWTMRHRNLITSEFSDTVNVIQTGDSAEHRDDVREGGQSVDGVLEVRCQQGRQLGRAVTEAGNNHFLKSYNASNIVDSSH
ncbi:unnamed protein product, partial [Euphydryas editha]